MPLFVRVVRSAGVVLNDDRKSFTLTLQSSRVFLPACLNRRLFNASNILLNVNLLLMTNGSTIIDKRPSRYFCTSWLRINSDYTIYKPSDLDVTTAPPCRVTVNPSCGHVYTQNTTVCCPNVNWGIKCYIASDLNSAQNTKLLFLSSLFRLSLLGVSTSYLFSFSLPVSQSGGSI